MGHVIKLYGFFLLLFMPVGYTAAATCGEISPSYAALGEQYFDLESQASQTPPASEQLPAALVQFLTSVEYASGTGQRTECKMVDSELKKNTVSFELEAIAVSTGKDEVVISATKLNSQERIEHKDSIAIPLQTELLELIAENQFNAFKTVRHYGASGSFFEELQLQATTDIDGQLEIKQWRYVNGELADWMSWMMQP